MPSCNAKCTSAARLDGKTVIVTGCNTGIGKESVKDFYKRGAKVIMACRTSSKAEEAKADIEKSLESEQSLGELMVKKLDLNSLASVREFAEEILREEPQINVLLNNAGVMLCPEGKTEDGFETQLGTNHLAHFLLTILLLPRIVKSAPARIVSVSSMGHQWGKIDFKDPNFEHKEYSSWDAYCQSKLANVLFIAELSRMLRAHGIENVNTYSLHPGAINTDLQRHTDSALFRGSLTLMKPLMKLFFKTPEQGAQTSIYCSLDEKCANESGLYYTECKVKKPADEALNEETAAKLWEMSEKMVKFNGPDPFVAK